MSNHYLRVLQLHDGATKADIKSAYRRLSKVYHPDVSKDPATHVKFIEITEAYKFLMDVGTRPSPVNATTSSTTQSYNYNPFVDEYEVRRRKAREFARWKAKEAARRHIESIRKVIKGFDVVMFMVIGFNILLVLDFILPNKIEKTPILEINYASIRSSRGGNYYAYDDVYFSHVRFRFEKGSIVDIDKNQTPTICSSLLLDVPIYAEFVTQNNQIVRINQLYSVYKTFGVIIWLIFGLFGIYRFAQISLDTQLTVGLIIFVLVIFQLNYFLRF